MSRRRRCLSVGRGGFDHDIAWVPKDSLCRLPLLNDGN